MCVFCCSENVYVNNFRFYLFHYTYSPLFDQCQCVLCNTQQQTKRSNRSSLYNVLDSCLNITRSSTVCLLRLIFQIFFHVSTILKIHLMWPMQLNTPHVSGVACPLRNLVKTYSLVFSSNTPKILLYCWLSVCFGSV